MSSSKYNICLIYLITIFQSFIFAYVIERVFGESRGLSVLEMQYLLILYAVFSVLFEIPAGVLADLWKKKYTLALGLFFCFFEFFISIYSYSFPMFSLVYFAAALGGSLRSGTMESLLYQTLKDEKKEAQFVKVMGRLKFIKYTVSGGAAVTGGLIADTYGYEMNYWLSLIGYPIAILFILALYEPKKFRQVTPSQKVSMTTMMSHVKQGIIIIWKNGNLRNVVLVSALIGAILFGQLHEMSMLLYPNLGIGVKYFGFVSLGITITGALSGLFTHQIKRVIKTPIYYVLLFLIAAVSIYLFGTLTQWWGVLFLMSAIGLLEALTIVYSGFVHAESPDDWRVTVSSVAAFILNVMSIGVGLLFGAISQWVSLQASFQMLAYLILMLILFQSSITINGKVLGIKVSWSKEKRGCN